MGGMASSSGEVLASLSGLSDRLDAHDSRFERIDAKLDDISRCVSAIATAPRDRSSGRGRAGLSLWPFLAVVFFLPACDGWPPAPVPTPTPTATPTPAPTPTPTPSPTPTPPVCAAETDLVASTCAREDFRAEVLRATTALGNLTGRDPQENLRRLAAQLRVQMLGRCVIAGHEAVFIQRDDELYEENHAVFFGNGGWTGSGAGKFIGCHLDRVPPVPTVCVDPDPRGLPAEFVLKPHNQLWDSTFRVRGRTYCDAAGFLGRLWCPLRQEGSLDREECERAIIGQQLWWCAGQPIESEPNPAQARCHAHVKTCVESGTTCSEADW